MDIKVENKYWNWSIDDYRIRFTTSKHNRYWFVRGFNTVWYDLIYFYKVMSNNNNRYKNCYLICG